MADVLAIGAHPDDVELTMSGLLLRLRDAGKSVAILDLTRGEAGTRGTPETRAKEAAAAAAMLGAERTILDHGDGRLENSEAVRRAVVEAIRRHRPSLVLAPHRGDLHPDHAAAGEAVRAVRYTCGMAKWSPGPHPPHRPRTFLFSLHHNSDQPASLIVDVSSVFERKMALVRHFASQLHDPTSREPRTSISSEDFFPRWEARHRWFGEKIGVRYGEPFVLEGPVPVDDPLALLRKDPA